MEQIERWEQRLRCNGKLYLGYDEIDKDVELKSLPQPVVVESVSVLVLKSE